MVWGCISWFSVGGMERAISRLNLAIHRRTRDFFTANSGSSRWPVWASSASTVIFQQDNNPKH